MRCNESDKSICANANDASLSVMDGWGYRVRGNKADTTTIENASVRKGERGEEEIVHCSFVENDNKSRHNTLPRKQPCPQMGPRVKVERIIENTRGKGWRGA